jgi:hypothetical protein
MREIEVAVEPSSKLVRVHLGRVVARAVVCEIETKRPITRYRYWTKERPGRLLSGRLVIDHERTGWEISFPASWWKTDRVRLLVVLSWVKSHGFVTTFVVRATVLPRRVFMEPAFQVVASGRTLMQTRARWVLLIVRLLEYPWVAVDGCGAERVEGRFHLCAIHDTVCSITRIP